MLKEFVEAIQENARDAEQATARQIKELGNRKFYVFDPSDSELQFGEYPPGPRRVLLDAVDQVPEFVGSLLGETGKNAPTVWLCASGIVVVCDDAPENHDQDRAEVLFDPHPEFLAVQLLAGKTFTRPRSLVRYLRYQVGDEALGEDGQTFLKALRRLEFRKSQTARHQNDVSGTSLGREVQAEVTSEEHDLTRFESVRLNVRVFTDRDIGGYRRQVKCGLEIDALGEEIEFAPLPGETQNAIDESLSTVESYLRQECTCPVYLGRPTAVEGDDCVSSQIIEDRKK